MYPRWRICWPIYRGAIIFECRDRPYDPPLTALNLFISQIDRQLPKNNVVVLCRLVGFDFAEATNCAFVEPNAPSCEIKVGGSIVPSS